MALGLTGSAAAAPAFVDGPAATLPGICTGTGAVVNAVVSRAGYVVEAATATPQLGQVVYVHAVASNVNPCGGDTLGFDFFFPPGTSFAISTKFPVQCFIGNGTTGSPAEKCQQEPTIGNRGGWFFGFQGGVAPGWSLEIQVPVIFNQALAAAPLRVTTTSAWGYFDASVGVTAPYQMMTAQPIILPLPLPFVQPTPIAGTRGDDLALLGSPSAGTSLPIAFSNDDGSFTVTNYDVGDFAVWARTSKMKRLSGDFNRDGWTDYALVGADGFHAIPVAMSRGNGQFVIYSYTSGVWDFGVWASRPNVTPIVGDFDRDGDSDIALVGGTDWNTIPVAWSNGNGSFNVTNTNNAGFAALAAVPGARPIAGDFNRDGMTDIALIGGAGWTALPVAFSYGNGSFNFTNNSVTTLRSTWGPGQFSYWYFNFAQAAAAPGAKVVTGDFNRDGMTDIAVVGGPHAYAAIETALSYGNGSFGLISDPEASFASAANMPNVKMLAGDFNKDGLADLALTGGSNWTTIPVAMSRSGGAYDVTTSDVGAFGSWASTPGVRAVAGDFNGDGYTDIALTGGAGWSSIPVAMSRSAGNFDIVNRVTLRFPAWSSDTTASVLVGRTH